MDLVTPTPPPTLHEQVRDVKLRLRGAMNGVVSQSMREKGLGYKVNFGVEVPRLREIAAELPHTAALAGALWKEDIRECRILAGLLQPAEAFPADLADLWVEQMRFTEEAEYTVLHLFSRLPYASQKVFEWVAREEPLFQLCGWLLLGRLLSRGMQPAGRDLQELTDQAQSAVGGSEYAVRLAASKALVRLEELSEPPACSCCTDNCSRG